MDQLVKQQEILYTDLKNAVRNYGKDSKARKSISYFQKRVASAKVLWEQFQANHQRIVSQASIENPSKIETSYFDNKVFSEAEEIYFTFTGELEDSLTSELQSLNVPNQLTNQENELTGTSTTTSSLKLPRISLPSFSGDYNEWTSFHDLFVALIHNKKGLSNAEKLHYLKASVHGEAERLIQGFAITDMNYETAWKVLQERYNNKRMLVSSQFDRLVNHMQATESAESIKRLHDTASESVETLKNMNVSDLGDFMIVYILTKKLPKDTLQLWEQQLANSSELPSFATLKQFLSTRFRTLEAVEFSRSSSVKPTTPVKSSVKFRSFIINKKTVCRLCGEDHLLRNCPNFTKLPFAEKNKVVRQNGLCLNCLGHGHLSANCPSKYSCIHCRKRHHSLLHISEPGVPSASLAPRSITAAPSDKPSINHLEAGVNALHLSTHKEILLSTALVTLQGSHGIQRTFRALIDQGSQSSFLSEYAAQSLALPKLSVVANISGLGKSEVGTSRAMVETAIIIPSRDNMLHIQALVLKSLTHNLPSKPISSCNWNHIQGLTLADPTFNLPGRIDVILGADVYGSLLLPEIRKGLKGQPIAQSTLLGWILCGEVLENIQGTPTTKTFTSIVSLSTLSQQMQQFWSIEEVPKSSLAKPEDQKCEAFYQDTHIRLKDGRYCVRLPFIDDKHKQSLGCSRSMAVRSFLGLEKRFEACPQLKSDYTQCINEYIQLQHMVPAKTTEKDNEVRTEDTSFYTCYYPSHHAVFKESTSTKLRVVFDASRKSSSGYSLNDVLLTGPTLQNELIGVLSRWRRHKAALLSDIVKMYRQVLMHPEDMNYQRIIWRNSPQEPLQDYCLATVTFGVTCAPFLAIRTIQQLARDESDTYPEASRILLQDFYVDDLLTGADSANEAITIYQNMDALLQRGGFKLKKWLSNDQQVLASVALDDRAIPDSINLNFDHSVKSLGVIWFPVSDTFGYKLNLSVEKLVSSKRELLSEIAKLYDPLGWIAPVIIAAKILMQSLWTLGCDWDETVPMRIQQSWATLKAQLSALEHLRIPRWFGTKKLSKDIEIHAFSDASQNAYAAVLYLRIPDPESNARVQIITSKTKVAPIKPVTIPRLELCGAVLAAKLVKHTCDILQLDDIKIHMWTDSTIVLSWLKGQPRKWTTFVSNRTSEVFNLVGNAPWHHVSSKDNPADFASRGILPNELIVSTLWWNGPQWLSKPSNQWPRSYNIVETEIETKKNVHAFHVQTADGTLLFELLRKFSSFSKLIRVTAYCMRVTSNVKGQQLRLSVHEVDKATRFWIKIHQGTHFSSDLNDIRKDNIISAKSRLKRLTPFIDNDGILRVGGRLQNAMLSYDERHPIILDRSCPLCTLIISKCHLSCMHGGTQLTLSLLRKNYWILDGRTAVRKVIHRCVTCFRWRAQTNTQLMGSLPRPRVNISKPFTHSGVDYCGPISIKSSNRRGAPATKGYIAVFVCLSTKAIHLELVSDLSSQAFLAALNRFIARRGICQHMYSDCETNFVGTNAYLKEIQSQQNRIADDVIQYGITWHFNPPHSPHFGGLWEAGVKSTKYHLRRIIGNATLTFEEMTTTLYQIEACLNSRPLCPISDDPTDLSALTPGHFLIGDALLALPQRDLTETNPTYLKRWQLTQQLFQHFWKRWAAEYISRLQQRPKWLKIQPNLKPGDLVLVKDDRLPPLQWPLGRVLKVYPGVDNLVRVVDVKMKNSVVRRPIAKLASLPTNDVCSTEFP